MKWPITCVDNFFDNPDEIVKFANTCEYENQMMENGQEEELNHFI